MSVNGDQADCTLELLMQCVLYLMLCDLMLIERNEEISYLPSFGTERAHVETTSDKLTSQLHNTYPSVFHSTYM